MEKLTVPGSSNLKAQIYVKKMKEKSVLLYLPKEKANFSKINVGKVTFLWRI